MTDLAAFMRRHFRHFNSRVALQAAEAWVMHQRAGGRMFVTLAGAMSTAGIGRSLAPLIRAGAVHGISCTGANLEEDLFLLLAADEYEPIDDWRALRAEDDAALLERSMNRVTDTCIPETVMRHLERRLQRRWETCTAEGVAKLPSEHLFDVLDDPDLAQHFQADPADSWVLAAKEMGIPIWTPGWEDSTTGNVLTALVMQGVLPHDRCVVTGTEQMRRLCDWYLAQRGHSVGFFQVGGGIAGDFAICAVPLLIQDLHVEDVPLWGYFAQISDAVTSYGGYSGAPPNEKITWGKLGTDTPRFMIQSDASIVAPMIFQYVLDASE